MVGEQARNGFLTRQSTPMTIRLRLTLFYTALLGIVLALFSAALFTLLTYNLERQVDRDLLERTSEVRATLLAAIDSQSLTPLSEIESRLLHDEEGLFTTPGIFVQLLDPTGKVVLRSPNLISDALVADPGREGSLNEVVWQTVRLRGQRVRLLTSPLVVGHKTVGTIRVGESLAPIDRTLEQLALLLVVGTLTAVGVVGGLGLKMAGRALAPVAWMSETARRIVDHGDLQTRLPVVNPADELGHLATTFNDALDRIALLFETQRRFVADAAHELRTPLTSIRGYTGLLKRGAANEPDVQNEALAIIDTEATRLTRLVNDLLMLAQSEAVPLEVVCEPVALIAVVTDVLRQERLLAPTHVWRLDRRAGPIVRGDPDRLHQLCLNLLDNARRHTPPGTHVDVTLDVSGAFAVLTISDDGPGIPDEARPHLFEPFFRPDHARHGEGAGLGLAIAARIAAAHDGTLEAANNPSGGASFKICLPLTTLDSDE
ncbi:MAG TPA: hypothetical protein DEP84_28570 [Chloroflexi bacterium]|nr:hypothetical protein [Chloroflexota bacterium]